MSEVKLGIAEKIQIIHQEAEKDLKIDLSNLENFFNRNELIVKWTRTLSKWRRLKIVFEHKLSVKYKDEYEKYAKTKYLDLNSKDANVFIRANEEYALIKNDLDLVEIAIDSIKQIISSINGQSYEIKNYIDWKKFTKGID